MQLRFHRGDRNGLLLVMLLAVLVLAPYLEKGEIARYAFNIMLTLAMVSGALSAAQAHGRLKLVGSVLALLILLSFFLTHSRNSSALAVVRTVEILFFVVVGTSIMGKVLSPGEVTLDKIFGAVSVYLMAGLLLGLTCSLLEDLIPGSFRGTSGGGPLNAADMVYFGYVTLTTLGYGDIVPVTAKARSLSMLGAIVGPLYVALLIASLVGDYKGRSAE